MDKGIVHVIFGEGRGKTSMALGRGIGAVARGQRVIMVQFLKGALSPELSEWMTRLEPDMKIFRFEKQGCYFESLSENEKKEEEYNIQNGINFARKVLSTGECDLLILDEFLGILDQNMISLEAAANPPASRPPGERSSRRPDVWRAPIAEKVCRRRLTGFFRTGLKAL